MTDYIDVPVRLPWRTICRLAVLALCARASFNDMAEAAVRDQIELFRDTLTLEELADLAGRHGMRARIEFVKK